MVKYFVQWCSLTFSGKVHIVRPYSTDSPRLVLTKYTLFLLHTPMHTHTHRDTRIHANNLILGYLCKYLVYKRCTRKGMNNYTVVSSCNKAVLMV